MLRGFFAEYGTLAQFSCPRAHAQNGVDERKHRHLLEAVHALMIVGSLPCYLSVDAALLPPISSRFSHLWGVISLKRLFGRSRDCSALRLFRYVCYVLLAPLPHPTHQIDSSFF